MLSIELFTECNEYFKLTNRVQSETLSNIQSADDGPYSAVGGTPVNIKQFPHMVILNNTFHQNQDSYKCKELFIIVTV